MPSPAESVVTAFFHASRTAGKNRRREIPGMDRLVASIFARNAAEDEQGEGGEPESLPWWWKDWPLVEITGLPVRPWAKSITSASQ